MKNQMGWTHRVVLTAAVALVAACGVPSAGELDAGAGFTRSDAGTRDVDAGTDAGANDDAGVGAMAMYPTWQLEDVQPQSPRFSQTYGLSAFAGRPLVVVLLEGF
ncbi:MAG: hypothetical protein Q8N23_18735 [Archangium sp.]|nr:hypothetical protein [Archangium sp.]MDP3154722.1 hypothetical protein [Archangium sp.]MDP3573612.1 hypothetical protein [Archangium sp.]